MKLDRVNIVPGVPQKYVHVYVFENGNTESFLWGSPEAEYHRDIVQEMEAEEIEIAHVDGGGRVHLIPETQKIYIWDTSTRYGDPDIEIVEKVLRNAYPDFEIYRQNPF